jgi:hypothetical protein
MNMIRNILTILAFLSLPIGVSAATFTFNPAVGSYDTDSTFTTSVFVNPSAGETISATKVSLSFPADKLEVVSYTPESAANILAHIGTSHDNVAGTIVDNVAFNPGITTSTKIATIVFKTKVAGQAQLSVASDSKLLDTNNVDKSASSPEASYVVVVPTDNTDSGEQDATVPTTSASQDADTSTDYAGSASSSQSAEQGSSTDEQSNADVDTTTEGADDTDTSVVTEDNDTANDSQVAAAASSGWLDGGLKTWSAILLLFIIGIFLLLFKRRKRN